MSKFRRFISVSAVAVLGVTNIRTPFSYVNAATGYDSLTDDDLKQNALRFVMPNKDVYLYAVTEPNKYFVRYEGNTHTSGEMGTGTFTYDETGHLAPNAFEKTGYTWSSWNTQSGGNGTSYVSGDAVWNWTIVESDVVPIYAQWSANHYNIIYNLNDSDGTTTGSHTQTPASLAYDETGNIANPERVGYSFAGWTISGMDGESHIVGGNPSTDTSASGVMGTGFKNLNANDGADVTFLATWTRNKVTYNVEHYLETLADGVYPATAETTDNLSGDADTEVKPATHIYNGFTANPANTPKSGNVNANGSTVFRYEYTRNSYELELTAGRGVQSVTATGTDNTSGITTNGSTTGSFKYDEPIKLSYTLKTGYQSPVWSGYSGAASSFNMPYTDAAKELNATPIVYTILYNTNGGTNNPSNPGSYTVESGDINLGEPIGTNSTFLGWTGTNVAGTSKSVTIASGSIGNRNYTAQWRCDTGYHAANSLNTGDVNYGNCIQNTDTAYKVEHYFQNVAGTNYVHDSAKDETKSGTTDTTTTEAGNAYPGFEVSSVDNQNIKGDGSTVVKVYYDRLSYSGIIHKDTGVVTAEGDGANSPVGGPYKHGDTVTITATTGDGYIFDGWTVRDASGNSVTVTNASGLTASFTMPIGKVDIYADAHTKEYTISYELHDGTATNPTTYTVEDSFTLNEPERDHSTFLGWSGTDITSAPEKPITINHVIGDRSYEAVWGCVTGYHASGANECVANEYQGKVDYADGEHGAPEIIEFTYDQVTTIPNPTQSGYDFAGWDIIGMSGDVEHYIGTLPVSGSTYSGSFATGYSNLSTDEGMTDIKFVARWTAKNDTEYVIYHYYKDLGATTYTLSGTDELTGTTDTEVVFAEKLKNKEGFTYIGGYLDVTNPTTRPSEGAVTTGNINKDGSTKIYLYYDRNVKHVYLSGNNNVTLVGESDYEYGANVEVTATPKTGYHFVEWEKRKSDRSKEL